jgi:hypothetical protein
MIIHLKPTDGNLYHNHSNQLRRAVGRHTVIYVGDRAGTVRDKAGQCWDWWETEQGILGTPFRRIKIVPAE